MVAITVNGVRHEIQAPDDTPLLYVLRNDLQLIGPQFGCGLAQCGACSVLIDSKEVRSCITPVGSVTKQEITTLEGLPARWAKQKGLSAEEAKNTLHPVQQAPDRNALHLAGDDRCRSDGGLLDRCSSPCGDHG